MTAMTRSISALCACLGALLGSLAQQPALASEKATPVDVQRPATTPDEAPPHLTGKWRGYRTMLLERGVDIGIIYKWELNSNLSGGIRRESTSLDNLDLWVEFDTEKLMNWKGGTFFFYGLGNRGGDPTIDNVGDAQSVTNIEAPNTFKLYEAWYEHRFAEDNISLRAGLEDLNAEFYVTDSSRLFLNSAFGVGTDLAQAGPSIFPTTSLALRAKVEARKSLYMQTALFDAVPGDPENPKGTHIKLDADDGLLVITEAGYVRGKEDKSQLYGKYAAGVWSFTRTFDSEYSVNSAGDPTPVTNHGLYFLAEQELVERFALFARYGMAPSSANRFTSNLSGGAQFTGLIPMRAVDRLGVGFTTVVNGVDYKRSEEAQGRGVKERETAVEFTYRAEFIPGLAIQPDFQFVLNPDSRDDRSDAKVFALRFELSL